MSLNSCDIQQSRNNNDKVVNNYGNRLLTLCKTLEVFIVNGRLGEDANRGKLTCNNVSLVDYFICSPSIFPIVSNFEVLDFDPLLSDIHCAVTLTLKHKCSNPRNVDLDKDYTTSQDNSYVRRPPNKPNWKSDLTHQYQQKLNETDISGIMLALNELTGDIPPQQCTINKLVDEINSVYTSTASDLGMLQCGQTPIGTKKHRVRTFPHRDWYDDECETKRKIYVKYKNKYRRLKNNENLILLRNSGRNYKKQINKAFKNYKQNTVRKIRLLKSENPKDYWNIINGKKPFNISDKMSPTNFFNHFSKLNKAEAEEIKPEFPLENAENLFNDNFTPSEVSKLLRNLKNNKSSGPDQILNEFLKYSPPNFIDMLTKFFNVILDTGIFPEQWSLAIIKPLYKNVGEREDPSNYRGISLLSCLGKVFSNLINDRLTRFVNENNIIGPEQAGFRSGFSTLDHIFSLKTLIDIYLNKHKILYCCYVDYSKAFDTVSRTELWSKLLNNNISGKLFQIIYNMYKSAKSCVSVNSTLTDNFSCMIGVRQGDNLSPLLFSIFLNDLKLFLEPAHDGLKIVNTLSVAIN